MQDRRHKRRTQDFTMEGIHVVGAVPPEVPQWGPGDGQRPSRRYGDDRVHQKLKQDVKLEYNF